MSNDCQSRGQMPYPTQQTHHIPSDLQLEDLDQEDTSCCEDDDETVFRSREFEVSDKRLVEVFAVLNVLEPVLTERLAFLVGLFESQRVSDAQFER